MNVQQILGSGTSKIDAQASSPTELGQDDFLELLVAQMKNQDPTNPADNSEFLSQIAQFSMVSGIDDLGSSFNGIAGTLYSAQAMQAAQLVGRDVLTEGNTALLQPGNDVSGSIQIEDASGAVTLNVRNAAGELVDVKNLGVTEAGAFNFTWQGLDSEGLSYPAGEYSFSAEAFNGGQKVAVPVRLFNSVESVSVDRNNTNILLHLASGESVGLSQISEYK